MRRAAEIAAFLGLSAAVHAGVMSGLGTSSGGPEGQGAQGADRISLQAAPENLAALAERWATPPDPMTSAAPGTADDLGQSWRLAHDHHTGNAWPVPALPQQTLAETPRWCGTRNQRLHALQCRSCRSPGNADARDTPRRTRARRISCLQRNGPPPLITPETPSNPALDAVAPAPPGGTELATATSPRPLVRPFDPLRPQPARHHRRNRPALRQGPTMAPLKARRPRRHRPRHAQCRRPPETDGPMGRADHGADRARTAACAGRRVRWCWHCKCRAAGNWRACRSPDPRVIRPWTRLR